MINKKTSIFVVLIMFPLLCSLSSCDDCTYYKTFDYKTMTFINPIKKSDCCVRFISQTEDKIELEVIYHGRKIKRTFIKKEGYWYSKYKYEVLDYLGKVENTIEMDYYIFKDYIVYEEFRVFYIDLLSNKIYYFENKKNKALKDITLSDVKEGEYDLIEYYPYFGRTYVRRSDWFKDKLIDKVEQEYSELWGKEDFFYTMDVEIYYFMDRTRPIYD
jgi:hypothetical protein